MASETVSTNDIASNSTGTTTISDSDVPTAETQVTQEHIDTPSPPTAVEQPKLGWISIAEGIKNIVETIAIIIAGVWALYNFVLKDSPRLFKVAQAEVNANIDSLDTKLVVVPITAKIENNGKSPFVVDSTRISYWLYPIDSLKKSLFFLPQKYMEVVSPSGSWSTDAFSNEYKLGDDSNQLFNITVPNDSSMMLLIKADFFFRHESILGDESMQTGAWTTLYHCVPNGESNKKKD